MATLRPLVVQRLLAVAEAGGVSRAHVAVAAEAVGVSERTVWRWLAAARRSDRVDPPGRRRFTPDDALWSCLSDLGGNVRALHRWMCDRARQDAENDDVPVAPVVSLTTLYHAVRRELRACRVLEIARPVRRAAVDDYDRALADLALPGRVDEQGRPTPPVPAAEAVRGTDPIAGPEPVDDGVRLYAPGAHAVSTRQLGDVAEVLVHTVAARGIVCVYGDTGHGKTIALHQALRLLPRRVPVHRALVAVKPALPPTAGRAAHGIRPAGRPPDEPHGCGRPRAAAGQRARGGRGHARRAQSPPRPRRPHQGRREAVNSFGAGDTAVDGTPHR